MYAPWSPTFDFIFLELWDFGDFGMCDAIMIFVRMLLVTRGYIDVYSIFFVVVKSTLGLLQIEFRFVTLYL